MEKIKTEDIDVLNTNITNYKIIFLGDRTVGKTSIIKCFNEKKFEESAVCTVGIDFVIKFIKRKDKKYKLDIWDTSGQERYKCLAESYCKNADGVIFVFDITNKQSMDNIKYWYNKIIESENINNLACVLVGNKSDLPNQMDTNTISFTQKYNMKYIQVSAKNNINIDEIFVIILDELIKKEKARQKEKSLKRGVSLSNAKPVEKKKCCLSK